MMRLGFFALFLLSFYAVNAVAQTPIISWPNTFSGQPDFDFEREEIVAELLGKKEELGFEPYIATIPDLLSAKVVEPYNPKPRYRKDNRSSNDNDNPFLPSELVANDAINSAEDISLSKLLPDSDVSTESELVAEEANHEVDLSEFEGFINKQLAEVRFATPDLTKHNFSSELSGLRLGSVVTSPEKYAVINGTKYVIGERFNLEVKVRAKAEDIAEKLESYMPDEDAMDAVTFVKYGELKESALKKYEEKVKEVEKERGLLSQNIKVLVKDIQKRAVILQVHGKDYRVKMRMVL